jgi:hypothetical protein
VALAASTAALVLAVGGSGLAGAASPTGVTQKVDIELTKGKLKFVGPASVAPGDQLEIVNDTNPKQVGPHTFSLVTKGSLPKTPGARKSCFTPKHICLAIATWHGFNPKTEKITKDPATAGPAGWSTAGNATGKKGDPQPGSHRRGGHDPLLHVRRPSLDAGQGGRRRAGSSAASHADQLTARPGSPQHRAAASGAEPFSALWAVALLPHSCPCGAGVAACCR